MPPKSKAGVRVVEIPTPLVPLLAAHLETRDGRPNPFNFVFPSKIGTPLSGKNVRRRHFMPAMQALGITGIRQHDLRRTFIALHVEAGTHPKLVQERAGHSSITLTMNVYGKIAGKMMLGAEQKARLDGLAIKALPAEIPATSTPRPDTEKATHAGRKSDRDSDSKSPAQ